MAANDSPGALTVRVDPAGDALVIRATGELDVATAETFDSELRGALASGALTVLLDLSQLEFIDSTGIRALLTGKELCSMNGSRFGILRKVSPAVRRSLEVSGVAKGLQFVD
jgi:anti-sigma B factor antagonist